MGCGDSKADNPKDFKAKRKREAEPFAQTKA
jgi:hypothetical protein